MLILFARKGRKNNNNNMLLIFYLRCASSWERIVENTQLQLIFFMLACAFSSTATRFAAPRTFLLDRDGAFFLLVRIVHQRNFIRLLPLFARWCLEIHEKISLHIMTTLDFGARRSCRLPVRNWLTLPINERVCSQSMQRRTRFEQKHPAAASYSWGQ